MLSEILLNVKIKVEMVCVKLLSLVCLDRGFSRIFVFVYAGSIHNVFWHSPHLAFVQINAEYAFGIRPNQRQMRVWYLSGMNVHLAFPGYRYWGGH